MVDIKKILIPEQHYIDLMTYVGKHADPNDALYERIVEDNRKKQRAIMANALYTSYKSGKDEEARIDARQKYLDFVGVPEDKRWSPQQDVNCTREVSNLVPKTE